METEDREPSRWLMPSLWVLGLAVPLAVMTWIWVWILITSN
jgi:hypothetical protein